jgi:hypothetical protein
MKIHSLIITTVIVVMVIGSPLTYSGFSFAASTNSTQGQSVTSPSSPLPSSSPTGGSYPCSNTDKYLWDHIYGKTDQSGKKIRLKDNGGCITVTGTVYSSGGTHEEPDGDLHFTLQLDPQYEKFSNQHDPQCIPHPAGSPSCKNIIVEVICHDKADQSYITTFGDYCKGVNSVFQGEPHQGDRLSVSGRWVQDLDQTVPNPHAPWNEIHPASNIHKIS